MGPGAYQAELGMGLLANRADCAALAPGAVWHHLAKFHYPALFRPALTGATMLAAKLTDNGQLVIPKLIRDALGNPPISRRAEK